jgi:xanthine dehydrogenase accessory factor
MPNLYLDLAARIRRKMPVALAVILETKGSTPQVPGASALFGTGRLLAGTVGGGALEAYVFKKAVEALSSGRPQIVEFSLEGTEAAGREPICGGGVRVLVDPRPGKTAEAFLALAASLEEGKGGVLATSIVGKRDGGIDVIRNWIPADNVGKREKEIAAAMRISRARLASVRPSVFLEPILPPARLIIAGAGHIGKAVAHLGRRLDFDVTVIDDRKEFADRKNVPDADRIIRGEIGPVLNGMDLDENVFVVIVTRGHEKDTEALRPCVNSAAAYVGMIGSRNKIALQRREFIARKWATARAFDRVHAPIGLTIGSQTVEEIAVSIAAELVKTRRGNKDKNRRNLNKKAASGDGRKGKPEKKAAGKKKAGKKK